MEKKKLSKPAKGWISPKEQLPNHEDWVLCQIQEKPYYVTCTFYDGIDSEEEPNFFWPNCQGGTEYEIDEVIAWKYPNQ